MNQAKDDVFRPHIRNIQLFPHAGSSIAAVYNLARQIALQTGVRVFFLFNGVRISMDRPTSYDSKTDK